MAENICQHTKICPIYNGIKEVTISSLILYKNVFCNRGFKGWNNCEQYLSYKKQALETEKQNN